MFVGCKHRPHHPEKHRLARELRVAGMPFKRIAKELEISPATAHRWTSDIELTAAQQSAIDAEMREVRAARVARWSEQCRSKRRGYQEEGRRKAREGDQLHLSGCMLYWAEGSKERNGLLFANSDPAMVGLYGRFLRDSLLVPADRITVRVNVYLRNGLTIEDVESYWLEILDLPSACLRKHVINHFPTSSSGRRRHKLPYGVCMVSVTSTRVVQHVFGAIQEYSGFDQPGWLDGPPSTKVSAQQ